jgi:hypothetical protein
VKHTASLFISPPFGPYQDYFSIITYITKQGNKAFRYRREFAKRLNILDFNEVNNLNIEARRFLVAALLEMTIIKKPLSPFAPSVIFLLRNQSKILIFKKTISTLDDSERSMKTDGIWFKDDDGRALILRGVNVSGATKVPVTPDGATYKKDSYLDSKKVSFVGRPFPLAEAEEHFSRLKYWGFTFIRFLVTWEAIEHAGPGIYDEDYIAYVREVLLIAKRFGIDVFIDPHQDGWSRWTGGDGAPGWTLEMLGMDLTKLHDSGAAFIHAYNGGTLPRMMWPTNLSKYGAATLFSLFFGGKDFAPNTKIDGVNAQEYLQDHYIKAIARLAEATKDLPNVTGFDTLNEPVHGYIGTQNLSTARHWMKYGHWHTMYESMLLASGYPIKVPYCEFKGFAMKKTRDETVNPDGISIWKDGNQCIWKSNGVWTDEGGTPKLLSPGYFFEHAGKRVDFAADYFKPFVKRYIQAIRASQPKAVIFIEEHLNGGAIPWSRTDEPACANATHWYDIKTLFTKQFGTFMTIDTESGVKFVCGEKGLRREFIRQLGRKKNFANAMGGIPTLIGEFGIPFDLDNGRAYRTGNFTKHEKALSINFDAMDALLLSATLWNYTPDNNNVYGDLWNGEDLSIFSRDQQKDKTDINSGGRAVLGFARPYARKIAGMPLAMSFNRKTRVFRLVFASDPAVNAKTVIFVSQAQYPNGFEVVLSDGTWEEDRADFTILIAHDPAQQEHTVEIKPVRFE